MSEQTYSIDQDLREAQAMADGLVPYVYEKELYRAVGGNLPTLTIGALLMRLRRLRTLQGKMSANQKAQFEQIDARHEQVRREWANAYEAKLVTEANSRLDAMKPYFEECGSAYMPEALRRTIVEEIRIAMRDYNIASADINSKTRYSDGKLRGCVQPSAFIWSATLQEVYANEPFWWLYNRPSKD